MPAPGPLPPTPFHLPAPDLDGVLEAARADLAVLAGSRILLTGATGFLGSWLLSSLLWANARIDLGLSLVVVSRTPARLGLEATPGLELLEGDVRRLRPGDLGAAPDFVVHGAASSVPRGGEAEVQEIESVIVDGTSAVLEAVAGTTPRLVFLSSGAVYGPQLGPVEETAAGELDPDDPGQAYARAKRRAEGRCLEADAAGDVEAVLARLFAFVGPKIPLDAHFAAGNFLADALARRAVTVRGDGRPRRSYLYTADLVEWCLALLVRGTPGRAYNVGSPEALTVAELAGRVAGLVEPPLGVQIDAPPGAGEPPWYVPVTARAESELGLSVRTPLHEALGRTLAWYRKKRA